LKKATNISTANITFIRGFFAFFTLSSIIYRSGTITWKKSSYDKNTFIVRGLIGGFGTFIGT